MNPFPVASTTISPHFETRPLQSEILRAEVAIVPQLIRDFLKRGRELYLQCSGPHPGGPVRGEGIAFTRRVPIDLSLFDPDLDHTDLKDKIHRKVCGPNKKRFLLIPQTDRQMRQGRQR